MPGRYVTRIWQYDPTLHAPARHRRACRYDTHLPDALASLNPTFDGELVGLVSEAEQALRDLDATAGAELAPFARLLLRTESIASSKVEGMQIGVRELARAEARAASGVTPSATAAEILANIDAMLLAVEEAATVERFGETELLTIHRRLLERAPHRHIAGNFRTTQNWIGGNNYNPCGADFVPPPPDEVPRLIADLCDVVNGSFHSPLVQAALVHAQFETIHPFDDGNGRAGRALIHLVLHRRGMTPRFVPPISVIFSSARDRYIAALMRFRNEGMEGVGAWIEHFAAATLDAARLAERHVIAVRTLQEHWREQLRGATRAPRADATAWKLIDLLPAHPILSAPMANRLTGRALGRVYEGIEQLVSVGVLVSITSSRRHQWWEASGLLDLMTTFETE